MMTVFELLDRVKQRPGRYLGRPSVHDLLFVFLNGYEAARANPPLAPPGRGTEVCNLEEEVFYDEFRLWLQERLGVRSVTSWAKLIMLSCHDEKAGFEQFFELLEAFKRRDEAEAMIA